jgi:hypothetical protein
MEHATTTAPASSTKLQKSTVLRGIFLKGKTQDRYITRCDKPELAITMCAQVSAKRFASHLYMHHPKACNAYVTFGYDKSTMIYEITIVFGVWIIAWMPPLGFSH